MRNSYSTRTMLSNSAPWPRSRTVFFLISWMLTIFVISAIHISHSSIDLPTTTTPSNCNGRRVHVYNLPQIFNREFLHHCATIKKGRDLCLYMENSSLGRGFRFGNEHGGPAAAETAMATNGLGSWYKTWQFALEVYFHERLVREYPCLTDEHLADAFFLPFYAGMDLSHRFTHRLKKDELYLELAKWVQGKKSWQRRRGRDHFVVLGRIASDFRRAGGGRAWGNEMLRQTAFQEMVVVSIERSSKRFLENASAEREIAIPYPTYFHASSSSNGELRSLLAWLHQSSQRVSLTTTVAGQRQPATNKMRHGLFTQCGDDPRCTLLLCVGHEAKPGVAAQITNVSLPVKMEGQTMEVSCDNPPLLLSAMHQSVFCLQPPGDSPTRRSFFDAMLVGCIPVIFHKEAAWSQYVHHLPEHGASYSVFIPMTVASKSNVIDILSNVGESKISEMQANIAKLVPRILYGRLHETGQIRTPPTTPDAFDIALETVLGKINSQTQNETSSGR